VGPRCRGQGVGSASLLQGLNHGNKSIPRIQPLDIPAHLPSAARHQNYVQQYASPADRQHRERNAMADILKGAVDPVTGQLDERKVALIALSGVTRQSSSALLKRPGAFDGRSGTTQTS
jgi:hypothetical protein